MILLHLSLVNQKVFKKQDPDVKVLKMGLKIKIFSK